MFSHPQHIIEIHERQVLEWTREQRHGWGSRAVTSPRHRSINGPNLLGRIASLIRTPFATRVARAASVPQSE